jgi:hypothetical protein
MLTQNGITSLLGVAAFLLGAATVKSCQQKKELVESYKQQLTQLRETIATQERQLSERTDTQVVVREDITEQKADGTVRRIKRERESVSVKQTETKEATKVAAKEETRESQSATRREVTESSRARLGLDVGIGTRLDAAKLGAGDVSDSFNWTLDVSYELGYHLAPVVGVEFSPAFGVPTSYSIGVEVRL